MRRILVAATVLGIMLSLPGSAAAGAVLGWHRGGGCGFAPPVVAYPYPYAYQYGYAPGTSYQPYGYYGRSYFRPDVPYGWNASRNWRDTWQDDGVKLHSYTWR